MRNKPGIPPETRQRVLNAVKELDYHLKSSATRHHVVHIPLRTLGMVIKSEPDLPPRANPFYSHVLAGIEDTCRQKKINLLYATLPVDDNNRPTEIPRLLMEETIEGLVLVGTFVDDGLTPILERQAVPIVLVDAYAQHEDFDSVVSDNRGGAYAAVGFLIRHGHRHIGMVGGNPTAYPSLRQRREGYVQALQDNGLMDTCFADCPSRQQAAFEATKHLLREHPRLTAVFGCNDAVTLGAVQAAQEMGRRVPEDFSAIGFDDVDFARRVRPALTTMRVDKAEMGRMAVQLLINRLEFPDTARTTLVIHPTLVERESVASLPSTSPASPSRRGFGDTDIPTAPP